jgi:hypothetical protein
MRSNSRDMAAPPAGTLGGPDIYAAARERTSDPWPVPSGSRYSN